MNYVTNVVFGIACHDKAVVCHENDRWVNTVFFAESSYLVAQSYTQSVSRIPVLDIEALRKKLATH